MLQTGMHGLLWAIAQSGVVAVALAIGLAEGAIAQIVPDDTLGAERSQVTAAGDRIEGGAQRGQNLFHSFREFNVGTGQQVYFANPADVRNIFSRVTGTNVSNIDGILGVDGSANLFLMNPNGIVFGQNARLDVGGSFVGTTASAIGFGDRGIFSTANPVAPSSLLRVNPSVLLFNQIHPAPIKNSSTVAAGRDSSDSFNFFGLRVPDGQSLLMVGGDISINGGNITALDGRIELVGLAGAGRVKLTSPGNNLNFEVPSSIPRANVSLINGAVAIVSGSRGGNINIDGRNVRVLQNSRLEAGILKGLGSANAQAGDITIDATGSVNVFGNSSVYNYVVGTGRGGDVVIRSRRLILQDGAEVAVYTLGNGNSGNILIQSADSVEVAGVSSERRSALNNTVLPQAEGDAGDLTIQTDRLTIRDGGQVAAFTQGNGNSGDLIVQARDFVEISGSPTGGVNTRLSTDATEDARGNAGDLTIDTRRLLVSNGQISASVLGDGDAGNLIIHASDLVELRGEVFGQNNRAILPGGIFAQVDVDDRGQGGNLVIETGRLRVSNGSKIQVGTLGQGDAGSLFIRASEIELFNTHQPRFFTGIYAGVLQAPTSRTLPTGEGGRLKVEANRLSIRDGAQLSAEVDGRGNGGDISLQVRDITEIVGVGRSAPSTIGAEVAPPSVTRPVNLERITGRGGNLSIKTRYLSIREGGRISASTYAAGNAGNIFIQASNQVEILGISPNGSLASSIQALVGSSASGRGGNITIDSQRLNLRNGALSARSQGNGNAGNILLNANQVTLDRGTITTTNRSSDGGNITLQNADLLTLLHGSRISTSAGLAQAGGNGGNITLNANLIAASANDNNDITANAFNGRGGAVNITGQLAGISLLSRDELQARLGTTNSQNLDPSDLPTNDITAVSQNAPTLNGQVTVNPPNLDPSRGLIELPTTPIDTTNQLSQVCPTNTQQADRLDSFIISRRGGLPPNPTDLLSTDNILSEWVTPGESGNANVKAASPPETQAIVEAQGWVRDAQGKVRLVAASASAAIAPASCPQR